MKKKLLLVLCLLSLNVALPNYNKSESSFDNSTVSAMGLYQENRSYSSYQGNAVWVSAVKNGQLCSGYIYYFHKELTWSGFKYHYSGDLRPGPHAPASLLVESE